MESGTKNINCLPCWRNMWAQVFVSSSQYVLWCTLVMLVAVSKKKKNLNFVNTWTASLHHIDVCNVSVGRHVVA